jgi:LmbE family N-acetylglucosaminyl deacetylase
MHFLDLGGDCRFDFSPNNAIAIARVIREVRPQVLLSPTAGGDQHPDHIVLSQLCRTATRLARYGGVGELRGGDPHSVDHHLEYAITRGAEPSDGRQKLCVDISAYYEPWMELMACHQTQLRTRRYLELQIARARSLGLTSGVEYAQALFPYNDFLINHLAELPPSVRLF